MATIKSYSDLQQSKKLAEILPLVSADMWWSRCTIIDFGYNTLKISYAVEPCNISQFRNTKEDVPCWSLSALLGVLTKHKMCHYDDRYYCQYISEGDEFPIYSTAAYDNPIDACVVMIEKLHELNLL